MNFIIRNKITFGGSILGAIGGYTYYYFVGCSNGSCLITSRPLNSTLYGSFMGSLFLNIFLKINQNLKNDTERRNYYS